MITLASGLSYLDLHFYGVKGVIASVILHGPGGAAIVDPGPSSTLPALRAGLEGAGLALSDVRSILLTHIHLDHAGATGTLVRENPSLRVYVHEKGAPHMALSVDIFEPVAQCLIAVDQGNVDDFPPDVLLEYRHHRRQRDRGLVEHGAPRLILLAGVHRAYAATAVAR